MIAGVSFRGDEPDGAMPADGGRRAAADRRRVMLRAGVIAGVVRAGHPALLGAALSRGAERLRIRARRA